MMTPDALALEHQIAVDRDVWEALQREAEPFVDTPNSVLRRKLGLEERAGPSDRLDTSANDGRESALTQPRGSASRRARGKPPSKQKRVRAPKGSLLSEDAYELPILRVLDAHGGRAAKREVVDEVGGLVHDELTELDKEVMANGAIRWQQRVQFARIHLAKRGLIAKDSPRGVWEITNEGRALVSEHAAAA